MRQVLENIEAGEIQAEISRRGIPPRQRLRVIFEPIDDGDISLIALADQGGAFDWLHDEPEIYTSADIRRPNV